MKDASVSGDLKVDGATTLVDTTINGPLTLNGDVFMDHGAAFETGHIAAYGDSTFEKNLTVNGTTDLKNTNVAGALDITEDANIHGNAAVDKSLTVKENATIEQNLTVNGTTDLKNTNVAGVLDVTEDANIHGNAAIDKSLTVKENATIEQNLTVNGTTDLKNTNIAGALDVTEDANIHGNAAVDKSLTVKENAAINGELTVAKDASIGGNVIATDAILGGQSVLGRLSELDSDIQDVGAGAAALAGLDYLPFEEGQKLNFAAGVGSYRGQQATALGLKYFFNRDASIQLATTLGASDNMVSGGLAIRLGRGGVKKTIADPETTKVIEELTAEVDTLKAQNSEMAAEMDALKAQVAQLLNAQPAK